MKKEILDLEKNELFRYLSKADNCPIQASETHYGMLKIFIKMLVNDTKEKGVDPGITLKFLELVCRELLEEL